MRLIFSILIIVVTMLLLAGCSKKLQPTIETVHNDSIVETIKYVPKKEIVYIDGEQVIIYDTIKCQDYEATATSATGKLTNTVSIKNGRLTSTCKQDSLQHIVEWLETELTKEKYSLKTRTETKYVPVDKLIKYTPKWHWYLHAVLLLLVLWIFRTPIISLAKHLLSKWN